jgi:phosphoenolpyruvate carboxylase
MMEKLYSNPVYAEHLARRNNKQNHYAWLFWNKDGGYLMAN